MSHIGKLCLVGLLITLAACSGQPERPQWIDTPQAAYPAATHLSAVGSGEDLQTASDRALANLARIFEAAVSDTSQDFSSAQSVGSGELQQTTNEQRVSREISIETRKVVEGATIAEQWQATDGRNYALAILDKNAAAARFRAAIQPLDTKVEELVTYGTKTAATPVAAMRALALARQTQLQRDELNRSLMIVANGQGIRSRYSLPDIENLLRNGLAELTIQVRADDASVAAELQRALTQMGVRVVTKDSYLSLAGSLDLAPVEQRQGWYWQRGSYELIFRQGEKVMAKQRWPLKASSTEEGLLEGRVRDEINRQLPARVFELLSTEP
ncbi:LPP20 family lipoprotein [Pseudomaricurvus sp. HS19]|uniref:LPP20 family lipoprotein n=1 Tax=Pseudomaricurvus sp. HS19 TaxID=2692626 RepID=UPI00136B2C23|nr:LPP20 family lipoprotein [Pseudomaricurvus sp. HS19]MYM62639.1 hypothetical protein [Pseudomaricurvus sp. HS19]